ncbi:MAG: hypothetical protein IT306_11825 [Chloroflexi bacterium]|nr:hypothetical protein [Chloroflexota bacterium]
MVDGWFVAKTKSRREAAATAVLQQRGIEVYFPTAPASGRSAAALAGHEALFPGYIFVRLAVETEQWLLARSAPGVAYFLGDGERPSPLPAELIDEIRARVDLRRGQRKLSPFQRGESVVIKHGPFSGLEAVFDGCLTARGRVRVLLEIVQRLVPVDLDLVQLARAG